MAMPKVPGLARLRKTTPDRIRNAYRMLMSHVLAISHFDNSGTSIWAYI
jgi:hypothetical protein